MRIRKNKLIIISNEIYDFDVCISTYTNKYVLKKKLIDLLPPESHNEIDEFLNGEFNGRARIFRTGQTVIQINKLSPDVVAHEIFHATSFIFEHIGMPHDSNSEEAYAYFIGFITREFYKYMVI